LVFEYPNRIKSKLFMHSYSNWLSKPKGTWFNNTRKFQFGWICQIQIFLTPLLSIILYFFFFWSSTISMWHRWGSTKLQLDDLSGLKNPTNETGYVDRLEGHVTIQLLCRQRQPKWPILVHFAWQLLILVSLSEHFGQLLVVSVYVAAYALIFSIYEAHFLYLIDFACINWPLHRETFWMILCLKIAELAYIKGKIPSKYFFLMCMTWSIGVMRSQA